MRRRIAEWLAHLFFGRAIDKYVASRSDVLFAYLKQAGYPPAQAGSIVIHDVPADRARFAVALMWSMRKLMGLPEED